MRRMNITGMLVKTWLKYEMLLIILIIILMGFIGFFILEKNFYNEQANTPPAIKEDKRLEKWLESLRVYGGSRGPPGYPTETEKINIELQVLINNRLTELNTAIERFNKTSTKLSMAMLFLSIVMADLVLFQIYLKVRDKKNQTPPQPMKFTY